jgi:hypothetical protein
MGALLDLAMQAAGGIGPTDRPNSALPDPAAEARRQRVLAMLAHRPGLRYAVVTDDTDSVNPDCVVLGIGIREDSETIYTADLIVPRESYDGIDLLELLQRHTEGCA